MMRFLQFTIFALLFSSTALAAEKLNVLFIAIDDLRPELGCYGNSIVKSPNIDALAKQGMQFNRAYCQFALCNPSRSSLLSGRRPDTIHIYDLKTFLRTDNPDIITLPQHFKNNGYFTLNFGKIFHATNGNHDDPISWSEKPWHGPATATSPANAPPVAPKPKGEGHSDDEPYASPDVSDEKLLDGKVAQKVIAALRANKDKPFFIGAGFHKPHMPFVAPKKYWDMYDPQQISLASNPFHPKNSPDYASNHASELRGYKGMPKDGPIPDDVSRNLLHGYYAATSYTDAQIGKVLAELDNLKLRDKTIVILWGDHGYQLGEHATWNKRTDWEICTRVPLIISVPGQANAGKQTTALVELVDMYPTLVELCGLTVPEKLDGTSFAPLIDDPNRPWKSAVFTVYRKDAGEGTQRFGRAMRTDQYRFVEWTGPANEPPAYELYDHKTDPQENTNIANQAESAELIKKLATQLHDGWRKAVPAK